MIVMWASGLASFRTNRAGRGAFSWVGGDGLALASPATARPSRRRRPQSIQQQRQLRALDQWLEVDRVRAGNARIRRIGPRVSAGLDPERDVYRRSGAGSGTTPRAIRHHGMACTPFSISHQVEFDGDGFDGNGRAQTA